VFEALPEIAEGLGRIRVDLLGQQADTSRAGEPVLEAGLADICLRTVAPRAATRANSCEAGKPPRSPSSRRANTGRLAKRWKRARSTEASRATSAGEWQPLMNA
jgi:hypothetical protein